MSIGSLGRRPGHRSPYYRSRYRRRDEDNFELQALKHVRNLVIAIIIYVGLYASLVAPWSFGDQVQMALEKAYSTNYDWSKVKEQAVRVSSWRPDWGLPTLAARRSPKTPSISFDSPLAGKVTSAFGPRINPISKAAEEHTGVDLEAKVGTVVSAASDGVVVSAGEEPGYGTCVRIDHGNGMVTLYAHLLRTPVKPQELVTKGQTVGWVGNTGTAEGYHLHFEVLESGKPVDPAKLVKFAQ